MSLEATTDPRIRPPIGRRSSPAQRTAAPQERAPPLAPAPFSAQGHRGANRVFDYGPGADHPTATVAFGLDELIDTLNPLQHLPVISSLYRHLTGDEIETPARIMGGTLYGGPLGFLTALATALVTEVGGADPGDAVLAQLLGSPESGSTDLAAPREAPGDAVPGDAAPRNAAGPSAEAALHGAAALKALAQDLARPSHHVAQLAESAQDHVPPVAAGAEVSPRDFFAARMLSGLDKYRAMARARATPGAAAKPGSLLDQRM